MLKYLVPFERLSFTSKLSSKAAIQRLGAATEPRKFFRLFRSEESRDYEGEVTGPDFNIRPILRYRNSFLPVLTGSIASSGSGSTITLSMKLDTFVLVFCAIWMSFVALVGVGVAVQLLQEPESSVWGFMPLIMLVIFAVIVNAAFRWEVSRQTRNLRRLLDATS